jgi:hypothetical protein
MRTCYRCLLWLHPPVFRREYSAEMLWIFDRTSPSQGAPGLLFDGLGSLARQWLLRTGWWKIALALTLAALEVIFGGLGALLFGRRRLIETATDPSVTSIAEFSHHGLIAHQPLTVGIVMYLAVFITGGLTVMVIGLTFWMKTFAARRRPVAHLRSSSIRVR